MKTLLRSAAAAALATSVDQRFNVFGVLLNFLVTPAETAHEVSLFKGILPPGVVIRLHSHAEPEVFYVLEGSLEVYRESGQPQGWSTTQRGGSARDSRQREARVTEHLSDIDDHTSRDARRTLQLLPLDSEALRGWADARTPVA